jgi:ADP-heptose:LPS heptosyltransferase
MPVDRVVLELVDGAIEYPVSTRSVRVLLSLAMQLRSLKADTLIYLMSNRPALLAWRDWLFFKLTGFVNIVGFPDKRNLRKNIIDEKNQTVEREAFRLIRCINKLGHIEVDNPSVWDLSLSVSERDRGQAFIKDLIKAPYFSINMGGKDPVKDWGADNWQTLFFSLKQKYPNFGLLVVGAASDFERAQRLLDCWPGSTAHACGKLSPRETAAAMEKSILFIGHDSGPLHLASAMGLYTIGLFGNHNLPNLWHPYSKISNVVHNMQGIMEITVQEVEIKIDFVLSSSN